MDIPGYQLNKVSHYYHLMYDQTHVENTVRNQAIQSALENLGEQEPHRLVNDETVGFTPGKRTNPHGNFPLTTIICTPPSPCRAASFATSAGAEDAAAVTRSNENEDKERSKVTSREEEMSRHGDDDVSGSSDSSIQILSEEHDVDMQSPSAGKQTPDPVQDNAVQIVLGNRQTSSEEPRGVEPQASQFKEEDDDEEEEHGLRRNSRSFVVLSSMSTTQAEVQLPEVAESTSAIPADGDPAGDLETKDTRSHSSTSSTSTTLTVTKSDTGTMLFEEDDGPSDNQSGSQVSSAEPADSQGDQRAPLSHDNSSTLHVSLERVSSQSSESDLVVQGRKFTQASSGPSSSQISYTGSLNENDDEEGIKRKQTWDLSSWVMSTSTSTSSVKCTWVLVGLHIRVWVLPTLEL